MPVPSALAVKTSKWDAEEKRMEKSERGPFLRHSKFIKMLEAAEITILVSAAKQARSAPARPWASPRVAMVPMAMLPWVKFEMALMPLPAACVVLTRRKGENSPRPLHLHRAVQAHFFGRPTLSLLLTL